MGLAEAAAEFACEVLAPGGAFLCKVFQGGTERELLDRAEARLRHRAPRQAAGQPRGIGRALRAGDRLPRAGVKGRAQRRCCKVSQPRDPAL